MAILDGELVITSIELGEVIIQKDINAFYLTTNDEPERKSTDSKRKHFCARLMFCDSNGHLKLYFVSYDSMIETIDKILEA